MKGWTGHLLWGQSVVKMPGATYELQPSFRVLVEGASEEAADDEVLWVKPQQRLPPVWDNVASAQQRQFEGTILANSAARVAAAHVSDTLIPACRRIVLFFASALSERLVRERDGGVSEDV